MLSTVPGLQWALNKYRYYYCSLHIYGLPKPGEIYLLSLCSRFFHFFQEDKSQNSKLYLAIDLKLLPQANSNQYLIFYKAIILIINIDAWHSTSLPLALTYHASSYFHRFAVVFWIFRYKSILLLLFVLVVWYLFYKWSLMERADT